MQQYLPFTVLKHKFGFEHEKLINKLQQYLPFTVLKRATSLRKRVNLRYLVATVLTVYGIETPQYGHLSTNSFLPVATVLTVYGIETQQRQLYLL